MEDYFLNNKILKEVEKKERELFIDEVLTGEYEEGELD